MFFKPEFVEINSKSISLSFNNVLSTRATDVVISPKTFYPIEGTPLQNETPAKFL